MASSSNSGTAPPTFVPPANYEDLARSTGREFPVLEALIAPFVEGFAVTDEAGRRALSELTGTRGLGNSTFLKTFFQWPSQVDPKLFKKILALGVDFSHPKVQLHLSNNEGTFTQFWPMLLKARVDVDVPSRLYGSTRGNSVIYSSMTLRQLWTQRPINQGSQVPAAPGPAATVAQLACDGDFYAVLSLIRRDALPYSEVRAKYDGRNVLEWARYYSQDFLAKELLFRYPFLAKESAPGPSAATANDMKDTLKKLQQDVIALGKENQALKQQLGQVKEYLGLCLEKVEKVDKNVEGKSKEVEEKLGDLEDTLKKDYVTRQGFKHYRDLIVKMRDMFNVCDDLGDGQ